MAISHGMLGSEELQEKQNILLKCYFADNSAAEKVQHYITELIPQAEISLSFVEAQDWNATWRESMQPIKVTPSIWVSPQWLEPPVNQDEHWIKIEPKLAFGSGHHETTQLASQAIVSISNVNENHTFLDIGAGSGILCFVADYAGFGTTVGVEIDGDCLENLAENRTLNRGMADPQFIIGTADAISKRATFDSIVMNMIRAHSEPLLSACKMLLKEQGNLIWSGILLVERNAVVHSAEKLDWTLIQEQSDGEWWCGTFKHKAPQI